MDSYLFADDTTLSICGDKLFQAIVDFSMNFIPFLGSEI